MNTKHKKYKNTGILFELLVRQITNDTLDNVDNSPAIRIVREFFKSDNILRKELLLYQALQKATFNTEEKANRFIDAVLEQYGKLNKSTLRRQKYNLIKEIRNSFDEIVFFKTKIPNYKVNASTYRLFENTFSSPVDKINVRYSLVETITGTQPASDNVQDAVIEEYNKQDKDLRALTYKILVSKFNDKYGDLDENQKSILREYINNVTNTTKLKTYINSCVNDVNKKLNYYINKVDDNILKIKLSEVKNQFNNIKDDDVVRDKHILSVMCSYELLRELNNEIK